MRLRRLPLMMEMSARSFGVMDLMIASMRRTSLPLRSMSCPCSCFLSPPMPGIMPRICSKEPSFRTFCICARKSSSVKSALRSFFSIFLASSASNVDCAFSMRESTSPMPRMRDAMRSGWKGSSASSFSPMPTNLIGQPVTALTDSAAPPRASPSSFVKTTPSMPSPSLKLSATFTAS